jgi:hypothetical protein
MSTTRLIPAILLATGVLLFGGAAHAQSDDAVAVLGAGGVENLDVFDLAQEPTRVIRLGTRKILPDDVGPARVSDFAILPDGSHLLADVDGRGAVVTTPGGDALRWVLDEQQRFTNVDSVAVGSYFAPGEPSQLIVGDTASSSVTIRSVSQQNVAWFESVRLTASRGDVVQVIAMPDNRIAFAVRWPSIGVSGIEVRNVADAMDSGSSFVSAAHAEASDSAIVVPELDGLVDLMGLPDGRLLVTTRFAISILSPQGEVIDSFGTGEFEAVHGELSSGRWLPTGRIAFTTFQPGEWVRPHTNHRVHWLDPQARMIVATSEALTRAPARLDSLAGHGGTGTFGFDGGLDEIQQGDPTAVSLVRLELSPQEVEVGERLTARATVQNDGEFPVGLSNLVVRGSAGECGADLQRDFAFATAQSVALASGQAFTVIDEQLIDSRVALGRWCVFVEAQDQTGTWHMIGEPTPLTVVEASGESDSVIEVTPLPFGAMGDAGFDTGPDAGDAGGSPLVNEGCCATANGRSGASSPWLVVIALMFIARTRRFFGSLWAADRARR